MLNEDVVDNVSDIRTSFYLLCNVSGRHLALISFGFDLLYTTWTTTRHQVEPMEFEPYVIWWRDSSVSCLVTSLLSATLTALGSSGTAARSSPTLNINIHVHIPVTYPLCWLIFKDQISGPDKAVGLVCLYLGSNFSAEWHLTYMYISVLVFEVMLKVVGWNSCISNTHEAVIFFLLSLVPEEWL